jgi:hypothetical protein
MSNPPAGRRSIGLRESQTELRKHGDNRDGMARSVVAAREYAFAAHTRGTAQTDVPAQRTKAQNTRSQTTYCSFFFLPSLFIQRSVFFTYGGLAEGTNGQRFRVGDSQGNLAIPWPIESSTPARMDVIGVVEHDNLARIGVGSLTSHVYYFSFFRSSRNLR